MNKVKRLKHPPCKGFEGVCVLTNNLVTKPLDIYPPGTETTVLKVPKKLKERLQQIGIALAWGDKEKALEVLDQD